MFIMQKQFNYVYLTTNLINGKQYVGDHSTNDLEKDYYLGGGSYLNRAIKKYGKKNFKKEILEFFSTKKDAFVAQEKYIIKFNTINPFGYNLSPAGGLQCSHGWSDKQKQKLSESHKGKTTWNKGIPCSEETKEKIRQKNKGRKITKEHAKKMHDANRGKPSWNKGLKGYRKNFKHSEETKKKISQAGKGKIPWIKGKHHSEETKKKISEKGKGNQLWLGKKHTEESKKKMSESHKGKIPANKGKHASLETRQKQSEIKKGKTAPIKGRKAIYKDMKKKYINKDEISFYLKEGWSLKK